MAPAKKSQQSRFPLYVPHREYPRPGAKAWIQQAASKFSLENPQGTGAPWIPLTAIEGFIVLGHKDVSSAPSEIPPELTVLVRMRGKDYDRLLSRCMESLTAFQNGNPTMASAWALFLARAADAEGSHKMPPPPHDTEWFRGRGVMHALQFIIDHKLTPRQSSVPVAKTFLKENKSIEWCIMALSHGEAIYPLDDLVASRLPVELLPAAVTNRYKALCYEKDDEGYHVLLPAGQSISVFETDVQSRLEKQVTICAAYVDPEAIATYVDSASVGSISSDEAVDASEATDSTELDCGEDPHLLQQRIENISDARDVVRRIIAEALSTNATDAHIDVLDASNAVVRLRHNGILQARGTMNIDMLGRVVSVIKIRTKGMNSTERRLPQDGKFKVRAGDREAEVRVSTIPVEKGVPQAESVALRFLGRARVTTLEEVGMTPYQIQQTRWILVRNYGIFFLTGPTGAGKTTTLNCMEREIAGEATQVMSIEDPVEVQIPWVKQVQVNNDIDFTFASALPKFLRHDPDAIVVGEVRDKETAQIAMEASLTGHLVFATLHANTVPMAITRLLELGIDRSILAGSVLGVAAQRLVRMLCNCREEVEIDSELRRYVKKYLDRLQHTLEAGEKSTVEVTSRSPEGRELVSAIGEWLSAGKTYRAGSCGVCRQSGFHKQRAVMELYLVGNEPPVFDMIVESKPTADIQKFFAHAGHLDIAGQCIRALTRHETTFDEIREHLPLL